jgi:hypothetical protein
MQELLTSLAASVSSFNFSSLLAFLVGAAGALVKDISDDGALSLPSFNKGKFYIGFLGGALIGGVAGFFTGGDILTQFLAGFTGLSVIASLVAGKSAQNTATHEEQTAAIANALSIGSIPVPDSSASPKEKISEICAARNFDAKLALAVAEAESSFNPSATHINEDGSIDRGLFQINSKYHPEVSEAQAFDPEFATNFFCDAVKAGNLSWWNSSKPQWIDKVFTA